LTDRTRGSYHPPYRAPFFPKTEARAITSRHPDRPIRRQAAMGGTDTRNLTRQLADYVTSARLEDIPEEARKEARRALVNFMGCALGGSRHEAMDITLAALGPYAGPPTARVLGRPEHTDPLLASLLNGISSHVHDYDDTTPSNYIHPTSPEASALFAYASMHPVRGADLELAYVL